MENVVNINCRIWLDKRDDKIYCEIPNKQVSALSTGKQGNTGAKQSNSGWKTFGDTTTIVGIGLSWLESVAKVAGMNGKILSKVLGNAGPVGLVLNIGINYYLWDSEKISAEQAIGSVTVNFATMGLASLAGTAIAGTALAGVAPLAVVGVFCLGIATDMLCGEDVGNFMKEAGFSVFSPIIATALDYFDPIHPFGTAATMQKVDPIALDLNGDGITFGSATDGYAQFDMDKNGFKERAAWLNNADGFLARDINGNGLIDDGSELFGDQTALKNGKTATDGFEALKDLDDNKDGILDKLDKTFQAIKIWQDKDRDGVTDEGELSSLADLGITSLSVNGKATNTKDHNGNTLNKEGSYTKADGTRGKIGEYALTRDTVHSEAADAADGEYSEAIKAAPDLAGQGNVVNLRRAMAEDKTGDLYKYVQKFITAATEIRENGLAG
jgi:hypothetical protein